MLLWTSNITDMIAESCGKCCGRQLHVCLPFHAEALDSSLQLCQHEDEPAWRVCNIMWKLITVQCRFQDNLFIWCTWSHCSNPGIIGWCLYHKIKMSHLYFLSNMHSCRLPFCLPFYIIRVLLWVPRKDSIDLMIQDSYAEIVPFRFSFLIACLVKDAF